MKENLTQQDELKAAYTALTSVIILQEAITKYSGVGEQKNDNTISTYPCYHDWCGGVVVGDSTTCTAGHSQ